jgi:hypothetical protein
VTVADPRLLTDEQLTLIRTEADESREWERWPVAVVHDLLDHLDAQAERLATYRAAHAALVERLTRQADQAATEVEHARAAGYEATEAYYDGRVAGLAAAIAAVAWLFPAAPQEGRQ